MTPRFYFVLLLLGPLAVTEQRAQTQGEMAKDDHFSFVEQGIARSALMSESKRP